ncbi:MAG: hypothetical protein QM518_09765 [Verrucomicrobiota bacterium]|nr:hypothetical protein [Verrucomicrobiota bacterium]
MDPAPLEIEIGIGIDPFPEWRLALMDRSHFTAELCQHRNNTDLPTGFPCPQPTPHPFDTDTDSDTDPDCLIPRRIAVRRAL